MTERMTCRGERGRRFEKGRAFIYIKAALRFHPIVFDGFWRQKCWLHSGDRLPSSISFIIHIRIPPQKDLSSSYYLLTVPSLSLLPFGLSPIRVRRVSHARDTHTGFNTPVSPQSSALFARCVDVFIGLSAYCAACQQFTLIHKR